MDVLLNKCVPGSSGKHVFIKKCLWHACRSLYVTYTPPFSQTHPVRESPTLPFSQTKQNEKPGKPWKTTEKQEQQKKKKREKTKKKRRKQENGLLSWDSKYRGEIHSLLLNEETAIHSLLLNEETATLIPFRRRETLSSLGRRRGHSLSSLWKEERYSLLFKEERSSLFFLERKGPLSYL